MWGEKQKKQKFDLVRGEAQMGANWGSFSIDTQNIPNIKASLCNF